MENNSIINVNPRLTDIIPGYGGINYIWRTGFDMEEKVPARHYVTRGVLILTQIVYNGFIGADILNFLEGKPTMTQKILENIL